MAPSTRVHEPLCKGCHKVAIHYRYLHQNDDSQLSWYSCQGCHLPDVPEYCPDCERHQGLPTEAPQTSRLPSISQAFTSSGYIERTSCSNCRKEKIQCSQLHTTATKCTRCLEHDLECDCKVLRTTCEYCYSRKLRCTGNEDSCTTCKRLQRHCQPLQRSTETRSTTNEARNLLPAKDPLDVIDGMKASLAFKSCLSCQQNPMLECDRELDGCTHCKIEKKECCYPSMTAAGLPDRTNRYCKSCHRRKSIFTEGPYCSSCKASESKKEQPKDKSGCRACKYPNLSHDDCQSCHRPKESKLVMDPSSPISLPQWFSEFEIPSIAVPATEPSNWLSPKISNEKEDAIAAYSNSQYYNQVLGDIMKGFPKEIKSTSSSSPFAGLNSQSTMSISGTSAAKTSSQGVTSTPHGSLFQGVQATASSTALPDWRDQYNGSEMRFNISHPLSVSLKKQPPSSDLQNTQAPFPVAVSGQVSSLYQDSMSTSLQPYPTWIPTKKIPKSNSQCKIGNANCSPQRPCQDCTSMIPHPATEPRTLQQRSKIERPLRGNMHYRTANGDEIRRYSFKEDFESKTKPEEFNCQFPGCNSHFFKQTDFRAHTMLHCQKSARHDGTSLPHSQKMAERVCDSCRDLRHICDGQLPICIACKTNGFYCSYKRQGMTTIESNTTSSEEESKITSKSATTLTEQVINSEEGNPDDLVDITTDISTIEITDSDVEDWCMVDTEDIDVDVGTVAAGKTKNKTTSRSYKFW